MDLNEIEKERKYSFIGVAPYNQQTTAVGKEQVHSSLLCSQHLSVHYLVHSVEGNTDLLFMSQQAIDTHLRVIQWFLHTFFHDTTTAPPLQLCVNAPGIL